MEVTNYDLFARIAFEEIEKKVFGTTQQLLEIHSCQCEGDLPRIVGIMEDENVAEVYFSIIDEPFYFVVYIVKLPCIEIIGSGTEPHVRVYLRATSSELTFDAICRLIKLTPTSGWNKDNKNWSMHAHRKFSSASFEPSIGPQQFGEQLEQLLDFIEQDIHGVANLVNAANAYVQVVIEYHNGNTMLGGPVISARSMRRLADLNLEIDFDIYAKGNFFIEE